MKINKLESTSAAVAVTPLLINNLLGFLEIVIFQLHIHRKCFLLTCFSDNSDNSFSSSMAALSSLMLALYKVVRPSIIPQKCGWQCPYWSSFSCCVLTVSHQCAVMNRIQTEKMGLSPSIEHCTLLCRVILITLILLGTLFVC